MIALDSALVQFNKTYLVVDGYLEHMAKKLEQLSAQGVEVGCDSPPLQLSMLSTLITLPCL